MFITTIKCFAVVCIVAKNCFLSLEREVTAKAETVRLAYSDGQQQ